MAISYALFAKVIHVCFSSVFLAIHRGGILLTLMLGVSEVARVTAGKLSWWTHRSGLMGVGASRYSGGKLV